MIGKFSSRKVALASALTLMITFLLLFYYSWSRILMFGMSSVGDFLDRDGSGDKVEDLHDMKGKDFHWDTLYRTYATKVKTALDNPDNLSQYKFLVNDAKNLQGLGNRLPILAACLVWAILTDRILLTDYTDFYTYWDPVDLPNIEYSRYLQYLAEYNNDASTLRWSTDNFNIDLYKTLMTADLNKEWERYKIVRIYSDDYPFPAFFVNTNYRPLLEQLFPDYNAFHHISKYLFRPSKHVLRLMDDLPTLSMNCSIGIHVRTMKYGLPDSHTAPMSNYASLTKQILIRNEWNMNNTHIYIAADSESTRQSLFQALTAKNLSKVSYQPGEFLSEKTIGQNPGNEVSAVIDTLVLSKCLEVITTYTSSFGMVAAGLGNVKFYIVNQERTKPEDRAFLYTSHMISEPCFYRSQRLVVSLDEQTRKLYGTYPFWMDSLQCHSLF